MTFKILINNNLFVNKLITLKKKAIRLNLNLINLMHEKM